MNLDDYSYEFEGRRYLNPQVSLDEQNAFIDNLRNMQTQNNAQIAKQTYNLGSQLPSSMGGLAGGSGYFKSRYQTPQMNQTIADLRAAAQGQALNTILNNEIAKVQKRYKDAYRAANERASNNNNNDGGTGIFDELGKLKIKTETNSPNDININDQTNAGQPNTAWITDSGDPVYTDKDGRTWYYTDIPGYNLPWNSDVSHTNPQNGEIVNYNGAQYIFIKNDQYGDGRWFLLDGKYFR